MKLAVPTETRPGERRVAMVPDVVKKPDGAGWTWPVQAGAGAEAAFPDAAYTEAGATVVAPTWPSIAGRRRVVVKVNPPTAEEAAGAARGRHVL